MPPPSNKKRRNPGKTLASWLGILRDTRGLPLILFLLACVDTAGLALLNASNAAGRLGWRETILHHTSDDASLNFWRAAFPCLRDQAVILLICMVPAFVVTLIRKRGSAIILPLTVACLGILLVGLTNDIFLNYRSAAESFLGEKPTPGSYFVKLGLIGFISLSPPVLVWLYQKNPVLDRYTIRNFLTPFTLCLFGFVIIWLIIDLSDNGPDFIDARNPASIGQIAGLYAFQLPQIIVLTLDITILLAMLYMLGKMSRANEIISMLGTGRSIWRVLAPLFLFGTYASLVSLAFNYEWAPQAERKKENLLSTLNEKYQQKTAARGVLYRNRDEFRTWFVGTIPIDFADKKKLRNVKVFQQDGDGRIIQSLVAKSATWLPPGDETPLGTWRFYKGRTREFDHRGIPKDTPFPGGKLYIENWSESPWKLQSGSLKPQYLGVQELRSYIATNSDLPKNKLAPFRTELAHRWALPWRCLVVVLIGAPFGIVHSRRGLLGGIASAMSISFLMFFFSAVFLALGTSGRIHPFVAAWLPNLAFTFVGLALLFFRDQNRELPTLHLAWRTANRTNQPAATH